MSNILTIDEFLADVKDGKMFSVTFARKVDKKVGGVIVEPAGSLRTMTARTGVSKGVKGVDEPEVRKAEDVRNNVLTVYDVNVMDANKNSGLPEDEWTKGAFRRINLAELKTVKLHGSTWNWNESLGVLIRV